MSARKIQTAILGSGNIGVDLMLKIAKTSPTLEVASLVGIDPNSQGLTMAQDLGIATTHEGLEGLRQSAGYADIQIVFDATSARAHEEHSAAVIADGKQMIDLTPAAIGPYVIPSVNLRQNLEHMNINMVTCGGQATIPIVAAISSVAKVHWGEIVASISSKSAGPGTRANIDEFVKTTSKAIEQVGGASCGRAIIIINPASPPLVMRDTVVCLCAPASEEDIKTSIRAQLGYVQKYVPGYRLKQDIQIETVNPADAIFVPGTTAAFSGLRVTVFLEVEGAGHFLPTYAGNLDIMTSAAMAAAEEICLARQWVKG